jgi:hypothetical protein
MRRQSLTVDISFSDDGPPTGDVVDARGVRVAFAGWLDLMQAISGLTSGEAGEAEMSQTETPAEAEGGAA